MVIPVANCAPLCYDVFAQITRGPQKNSLSMTCFVFTPYREENTLIFRRSVYYFRQSTANKSSGFFISRSQNTGCAIANCWFQSCSSSTLVTSYSYYPINRAMNFPCIRSQSTRCALALDIIWKFGFGFGNLFDPVVSFPRFAQVTPYIFH